jgi:cytochrome c oxidase cbb3-type subunit 4
MLKFIKHNLESIEGVEIYPIISLVLFFLVFSAMLVFVFRLPKKRIDNLSNLPFDNDTNTKETTNE